MPDMVPSVAIKEGVYKSLQITEEHFKGIYAGVPVDFFLYDSGKLGQVRNFATSSTIQVMVVTVGAINKKDVTCETCCWTQRREDQVRRGALCSVGGR